MRRRDFVKGILAASAAAKALAAQQAAPTAPAAAPAAQHLMPPAAPVAPGPVPWMRGLMDAKPLEMSTLVPDAVAQTEAHFFNEQQTKTLRRLCEVLMPPLKGRPGALDTGAPEFLDFLIGVSPRDRKQMYLGGLDRLDAEARNRFGGAFAATTDAQADALLRLWLRAWMTDHPPTEPFARFINLAHSDIRMATINSQVWSEAVRAEGRAAAGVDLYWYPVDPDMHRDADTPALRVAANKVLG
jgi:hypothetical protein